VLELNGGVCRTVQERQHSSLRECMLQIEKGLVKELIAFGNCGWLSPAKKKEK
jgi:hypothetical protein